MHGAPQKNHKRQNQVRHLPCFADDAADAEAETRRYVSDRHSILLWRWRRLSFIEFHCSLRFNSGATQSRRSNEGIISTVALAHVEAKNKTNRPANECTGAIDKTKNVDTSVFEKAGGSRRWRLKVKF